MRLRRSSCLLLPFLLASPPAWAAGQGAGLAAVTPGRDGRAEVHVEVQDAALAAELRAGPKPERFRVLVKAGQARVEQAARLADTTEGSYTVLAFDQSGSFRPYTADAVALARRFVGAAPPRSTLAILSFGTTLGDPKEAASAAAAAPLLDEVSKARPQPQTRLKASIRESVLLASGKLPMPKGTRQVVVFTDAGEESSAYSIAQVLAEARERGVRVHTVVFGSAQQGGATLAQRRDEMKQLAEESGGVNVEVRDKAAAGAALEGIARSPEAIYRLSLRFCEVPAFVRDDQIKVEVLRGSGGAASSGWASFSQQGGGEASRPCGSAPAPSASEQRPPAPGVAPAPVEPSPLPGLLKLLAGLGGAAVLAAVLALLLHKRAPAPAPPPPAPPPPPPEPERPPAPLAPLVDPKAAAASLTAVASLPEVWLLVARGPGEGSSLRIAKNPFVIGAAKGSDLRFDLGEVSGRHVIFEVDADGSVHVTDQGSTNGTFTAGQRLSRGQRVRVPFGQSVLVSSKVELRLLRSRPQ